MTETKELSNIRSRIDVLLDNIEDAMDTIDFESTEIGDYIHELKEIMVKSGERLGN